MPRIKMFIDTGFAGARHEDYTDFDDDIWAGMTEEAREKELDDIAQEYLVNHIECGAFVVD